MQTKLIVKQKAASIRKRNDTSEQLCEPSSSFNFNLAVVKVSGNLGHRFEKTQCFFFYTLLSGLSKRGPVTNRSLVVQERGILREGGYRIKFDQTLSWVRNWNQLLVFQNFEVGFFGQGKCILRKFSFIDKKSASFDFVLLYFPLIL